MTPVLIWEFYLCCVITGPNLDLKLWGEVNVKREYILYRKLFYSALIQSWENIRKAIKGALTLS